MGQWYYVVGSDRVGPVEESELRALFDAGKIEKDSYVWCKVYENWKHLSDAEELSYFFAGPSEIESEDATKVYEDKIPDPIEEVSLDWARVGTRAKLFSLKIGLDRGKSENIYGPFSLEMIKKLYDENRVNEKTYIFSPGMENWIFLGDIPIYEKIFSNLPPTIDDSDRRLDVRKPFIARLLFHNEKNVFEGVCRDISIGGLQLLVSEVSANENDEISLNVHPDNGDHSFTAKGRIVRVLNGGQGFSLRFIDLSEEAKNAINSYVN